MQITKAVITAAGRGARQYPGVRHRAEGHAAAGRSRRADQARPPDHRRGGDRERDRGDLRRQRPGRRGGLSPALPQLRRQPPVGVKGVDWAEEQARRLVDLEQRLHFAVQPEPEGYGHAVWCARTFVGDQPFLLLLGDHLYVSAEPRRCARQLLDLAAAEDCAVSAVQATREHLIHQYGTLDRPAAARAPRGLRHRRDHREAEPDPGRAAAPGARPPRGALPLLLRHARADARRSSTCSTSWSAATSASSGQIQLTTALNALARRERYLALETRGSRFNLGVKFGVVEAQIALALAGVDRERILALLLESIVRIEQNCARVSPLPPTESDSLAIPRNR